MKKQESEGSIFTQMAPSPQREMKRRRQPRYNVVLWNDNDHTFDYVVRMMQELFGFPAEAGYQIASHVDHIGRAVCMTTTMEHAELKRDQVHAFGKDKLIGACKGSMSCSIEPVE